MSVWKLRDARNRLSELVRQAKRQGPQAISVRGVTEVVVIAKGEYDRLRQPKPPFWEFMRASPLVGVELDLERDPSPTRKTEEISDPWSSTPD